MTTLQEQENVDLREQASQKLTAELAKLEKELLQNKKFQMKLPKEDVCTLYLNGKVLEINRLNDEITCFNNPEGHFTKAYRTLEGHCGKLQTDLDKIDVFARDDIRKTRKEAFLTVEEMLKVLITKAHPTGEVCKECEVQN